MKHISKLIVRTFVLITLILLANCQKDDGIDNTNHDQKIQERGKQLLVINAKDIPNILGFIADEQKGFLPSLEPNNLNGNRSLNTSNPFGSIDDSTILALEDIEGNRTYTFKVQEFNQVDNAFYNLIVVTDSEANIIKSYIKAYQSNDGKKFDIDFTGTSIKYDLEGNLLNEKHFNRGSGGEVPDCTPCIEPEDEQEEEDNDDDTTDDPQGESTNTGSNSGGGGPTNGGTQTGNTNTGQGNTGDSGNSSNGNGSSSSGSSDSTGGDLCGGATPVYDDCSKNYVEIWDFGDFTAEITVDCCGVPIVSHRNSELQDLLPCCDEDTAVIDDEDDPCNILSQLEDDDDFKLALQSLKDLAATDNKETGYVLQKNENTSSFGYNYFGPYHGEIETLQMNMNFADDVQYDGFMHNHYNDNENKDISIFSPHDLYSLYIWLQNNHMVNSETFFSFVTTNHGTTYALNVIDPQAFLAFGNAVFTNWDDEIDDNDNPVLLDEYEGKVGTSTYPTGIKNGNSNDTNEVNFMKLLNHPHIDLGLNLYIADENFENWKKVNLENNQTNYTNCN